jgi:hypothetical protein
VMALPSIRSHPLRPVSGEIASDAQTTVDGFWLATFDAAAKTKTAQHH